jgi:hypothetical protein
VRFFGAFTRELTFAAFLATPLDLRLAAMSRVYGIFTRRRQEFIRGRRGVASGSLGVRGGASAADPW